MLKKIFAPQIARRIAYGILSIPAGFLLLFTFGEVLSGDLSGLSHLAQLVPIVVLAVLAIKKPKWAGMLLVSSSALLGIWYVFTAPFDPITIVIVEVLLFLPPFIAGALLLFSERRSKNTSH